MPSQTQLFLFKHSPNDFLLSLIQWVPAEARVPVLAPAHPRRLSFHQATLTLKVLHPCLPNRQGYAQIAVTPTS